MIKVIFTSILFAYGKPHTMEVDVSSIFDTIASEGYVVNPAPRFKYVPRELRMIRSLIVEISLYDYKRKTCTVNRQELPKEKYFGIIRILIEYIHSLLVTRNQQYFEQIKSFDKTLTPLQIFAKYEDRREYESPENCFGIKLSYLEILLKEILGSNIYEKEFRSLIITDKNSENCSSLGFLNDLN